ncbi:MAG: MBL fold metallo-hydrolase [Verrucomicrobiae bacterium]|nr:MBL fold metallo-hydrolase [Verrucomicrobiae bacterium]
MQIGPYELHSIETGRFSLDGGAMFGSVPKPLWEKTSPADERNRIELASRSLLIVGNGRKILVDNGCGSKWSPKLADMYKIDTSRFELRRSLALAGVRPEEITDVILTHLHFDHAGGSTFVEGGEVKPTFPNARHYVQKAHWEWMLNPTEKDRASFMADDFMPLHKRGILEFVDGEGELFPCISLLVMNGHTTAQQLPMITNGNTVLLFCCDLIPTASHVPLPYIMGYDLRPLTTLADKKRVLGKAWEEQWILYFQHDPRIVAARIKATEKGFVWDRESVVKI